MSLDQNTTAGDVSSVGTPQPQPNHGRAAVAIHSGSGPFLLQGWRLWGHRLGMLLFVVCCAVLGMLLVILPWRPDWTDNHLLFATPALRALLASGFVRGVCTGLGLLDIWIGLREAVYYTELHSPPENRSGSGS